MNALVQDVLVQGGNDIMTTTVEDTHSILRVGHARHAQQILSLLLGLDHLLLMVDIRS